MTAITEKQKDEFYQGFITAMLWSTGGEADYSEAPAGYVVAHLTAGEGGWVWGTETSTEGGSCSTEREAIAAAWTHSGETPPVLESLEGFDLAPITETNTRAHCDKWIDDNAALLALHADVRDDDHTDGSTPWECAGHDFWLTSAGHGVGFWDRGLGELGDQLTAACEKFRDKHDAYIGDDGLVHVSGMESEPSTTVRVAWEIDIELAPGETFDDAARQAVVIMHDQCARAKGAENGSTRPALTIEGELFDLEEYPDIMPPAVGVTITLTEAQRMDLEELINLGAADAVIAARLPDFDDVQAGSLERLGTTAAAELIKLLNGGTA